MISLPMRRQVITFYSFKGGVGRTMTLANIAYRLAYHHGMRVIAVDWDLEAPGLQSFFRVPANTLKKARGLLDYCEAWESAYRERATELPDPLSYLLPIGPVEPEGNEDTRGSLQLLLAGKQDAHYDARLGRFDWKRFYAESAGAGAIEHLRSRFADNADFVLIDSRTGLTDPGGICTIQIPDAVVLMSAPNQQSLDGIERIAQSIATASPEARVGRGTARVFLCMSRVPLVEESYQAREWFKTQEPRFTKGVENGLWRSEDHRFGLDTHVIPQRGTYGFDESLVGRAVGALEREPLAQAYDKLTHTLLQWKWETVWNRKPITETELSTRLAETKKEVARAKRKSNPIDLASALAERATVLSAANQLDETLVVTQEAVALAEKITDPAVLAMIYFIHSSALYNRRQFAAARDACQTSISHAERTTDPALIALTHAQLGNILIMLGQEHEGTKLALSAIADLRANGKVEAADQALSLLHSTQVLHGLVRETVRRQQDSIDLTEKSILQLRVIIALTRQLDKAHEEAIAIRKLLEFASENDVKLPDEVQHRQRLQELEGPPNPAPALTPSKTKRRRAKG